MANEHEQEKPRGFAALPPEERRRIARLGGRAVDRAGTGHKFTPEEARAAGQKSGAQKTTEQMAEIGRRGGLARAARYAERRAEKEAVDARARELAQQAGGGAK